jgi:hypothetical protein
VKDNIVTVYTGCPKTGIPSKLRGKPQRQETRAKLYKSVTLQRESEIKTFASTTEASRFIGVSDAMISHVKVGRAYSANGWHLPNTISE